MKKNGIEDKDDMFERYKEEYKWYNFKSTYYKVAAELKLKVPKRDQAKDETATAPETQTAPPEVKEDQKQEESEEEDGSHSLTNSFIGEPQKLVGKKRTFEEAFDHLRSLTEKVAKLKKELAEAEQE